jgi:carboxylate-amine ligase
MGLKTPGWVIRRTEAMMSSPVTSQTGTRASLRAAFDAPAPLTVGVEEELMLLDPATLDLAPRAREALAQLGGDPRFKLELPASHLEIVLPPLPSASEAATALRAARADLVAALGSDLRFASAGVHPFTNPLGELNRGARYDAIRERFGDVARLQLVCALQVHVAVRDADRALAVYNWMRSYMPLVAALAANAPVIAGRDTGLASVRPKICDVLPRQGVAPVIASWEAHDATLARLRDPSEWWWELRPHPVHGTLEVRVPDGQASVEEAEAIVAVVHALAAWLVARVDSGESLEVPPDWVVGEDRWLACREGAAGALRPRVYALLDALEPVAEQLGGVRGLETARRLADRGAWQRQRALFERDGARSVVADLADRFCSG